MTPQPTDEELKAALVCRCCGATLNGAQHLDGCPVAPPEWGPRSEWPEGLVHWVCVSDCDVPTAPAPTPEELDRWQWAASAGFRLDFIPSARLIAALRASQEEVMAYAVGDGFERGFHYGELTGVKKVEQLRAEVERLRWWLDRADPDCEAWDDDAWAAR